jgi:hypothetical protein
VLEDFQKRIKKKTLFSETINHDFSFLSKGVCDDPVQETIDEIYTLGIESLLQDLDDILIDNEVRYEAYMPPEDCDEDSENINAVDIEVDSLYNANFSNSISVAGEYGASLLL